MKEIKNVCVIGAGLMGRQIALNTASYGYSVVLNDGFPEALKKAEDWTVDYLAGRVEKAKMTAEKAAEIKSLIVYQGDLAKALADADLIIEAIIEDRAIKNELFKNLNKLAKKDAIIATNSSFMPSSLFAEFLDDSSRFANLHYFNPALVMKLTEVVQGPHTAKETVDVLMDFSMKTGKDPIWLRKEIDGFVANRLLRSIKNEAMELLDQGIATAPEIDMAAEKGLNYPMGPFRLMDLTGIDLSYLSSKRVLDETGVKMPGHDRLEEKYNAKEWGKKTGKGWYDYTTK